MIFIAKTLANVIFLMSSYYVLYYGSHFEISQKMMLIFIGGLEKSKACEQFTQSLANCILEFTGGLGFHRIS